MQVEFVPPSELDTTVQASQLGKNALELRPKFFLPKGPAILGTLVSRDARQRVLDRAVLAVNGRGTLSLLHRNKEVAPLADQEEGEASQEGGGEENGGANQSSADDDAC